MAPATSPTGAWSALAAIFITLFILSLAAGGLALRALLRTRQALAADIELGRMPNPHPFGSEAWRALEDSRAAQAERDALEIASLEAQVDLLQQAAGSLESALDIVQGDNKRLVGRLAEEQRRLAVEKHRFEPVDPEAVRRTYEEMMHRPLGQSPYQEQMQQQEEERTPLSPVSRSDLQTAKVHDIMDRNSQRSPQRRIRLESAAHPVRPQSASIVDHADPFCDPQSPTI